MIITFYRQRHSKKKKINKNTFQPRSAHRFLKCGGGGRGPTSSKKFWQQKPKKRRGEFSNPEIPKPWRERDWYVVFLYLLFHSWFPYMLHRKVSGVRKSGGSKPLPLPPPFQLMLRACFVWPFIKKPLITA